MCLWLMYTLRASTAPELAKDMSLDKPPWEWLIVPNVKRADGSVVHIRIFRLHHGYMDGVSLLIFLMENLIDPVPRKALYCDPRVKLSWKWVKLSWKVALINLYSILLFPSIVLQGKKMSERPGPF